jgi:quercetin dioxygenase-like cupin family protein
MEGTWYVGEGDKFDTAKLKGYPAGSFIVIPAGLPHFVEAKSDSVIVQVSGTGKFGTDYSREISRRRSQNIKRLR